MTETASFDMFAELVTRWLEQKNERIMSDVEELRTRVEAASRSTKTPKLDHLERLGPPPSNIWFPGPDCVSWKGSFHPDRSIGAGLG